MWQIVSNRKKIDKQSNHNLPHEIDVKNDALQELLTSKPTTPG